MEESCECIVQVRSGAVFRLGLRSLRTLIFLISIRVLCTRLAFVVACIGPHAVCFASGQQPPQQRLLLPEHRRYHHPRFLSPCRCRHFHRHFHRHRHRPLQPTGSFSLGMFQTFAPANSSYGCQPEDRCAIDVRVLPAASFSSLCSLKAAMAAFEAGGKTWKLWSTCVGCGVCAGP